MEKKLYRCTSTFSALNYCRGIFFKSLSYLYEMVRKTFPPIIGLFVIFDGNFAKIVSPPGDINEKHLVHLTEQSILKKIDKMASKSTQKPSHNTCLNYVPTRRQSKRDIQKTPIFAPTAGARSSISPELCKLIMNVGTILKGVNHFSIQLIVFPVGAKC